MFGRIDTPSRGIEKIVQVALLFAGVQWGVWKLFKNSLTAWKVMKAAPRVLGSMTLLVEHWMLEISPS